MTKRAPDIDSTQLELAAAAGSTASLVQLAEIATGFAPLANQRARLLILGSMPGVASLAAKQYYAHARNAFWPIMCTLLNIDPGLPYAMRMAALRREGIALWDVLQSCTRRGSLDTAIERHSEVANDFANFFRTHPTIHRVYFNGSKAEASFMRHVAPTVDLSALTLTRLPSTSPAHATRGIGQKLAAWRVILDATPAA